MPRLALPLLASTLLIASCAMSHAQTSTVTTGPNGVSGNTTVTTGPNGKPCQVVHSDDAKNTGNLSSSVTAGPGGVHSSTSGGTLRHRELRQRSVEQHVEFRCEFLLERHDHDDQQQWRLCRHRAQGQEVRSPT